MLKYYFQKKKEHKVSTIIKNNNRKKKKELVFFQQQISTLEKLPWSTFILVSSEKNNSPSCRTEISQDGDSGDEKLQWKVPHFATETGESAFVLPSRAVIIIIIIFTGKWKTTKDPGNPFFLAAATFSFCIDELVKTILLALHVWRASAFLIWNCSRYFLSTSPSKSFHYYFHSNFKLIIGPIWSLNGTFIAVRVVQFLLGFSVCVFYEMA